MILKIIANFFAKKGLASHEADTRAAIARFEREKEASEFRINERIMGLRDNLSSQANKREEDLKEYIDKLNEFVNVATEIQPLVHKLYEQMFEAFEVWGRMKLRQQDMAIELSKRDLLQKEVNLFKDALKALEQMAQNEDKFHWKKLTSTEPLLLNNAYITKEMRAVERWQKTQDREYQIQHLRVVSAIRENKAKLTKCRTNIRDIREDLKPLNDELKMNREQVRGTYNILRDSWRAAQDNVKSMFAGKCDDLYYHVEKEDDLEGTFVESSLLSSISNLFGNKAETASKESCIPDNWGSMNELKSSFDFYRDDLNDLFDDKKEHQEELNKYSLKIKQARVNDDYGTFDSDKIQRTLAYQMKNECQQQIALIKPQKNQLGAHLSEIRKMLGWLEEISPQRYLENMYKMCEEMQDDGAEMYWRTVNIRTSTLIPPTLTDPSTRHSNYNNKGKQ
jgi:hypothetical protein